MRSPVPRLGGRLLAFVPEPGPGRTLAVISLLGSLGFGLYQAGSVLYFVRFVGLPALRVGFGFSVAGAVGLVVGLAAGRFADRLGARRVAIWAAIGKTVPLLFAPWVNDFVQFLVVVTALSVAESAWIVANEALLARVVTGHTRVHLSAVLRSIFNVGLTLGSLAASVALAIDTRAACATLVAAYGIASLLEALVCAQMPADLRPDAPAEAVRPGRALHDLPYLGVSLHSSLTTLGDTILVVGLPLWIVSDTAAPPAVAAWLIALNTVLVVCFQVRAARSAATVPGAVRTQEWALAALTGCCAAIGLAGLVPLGVAVTLLVIGVLALTAGEIWGQGARFALRFSLAPPHAQGEYGAVFRLGLLLPRVAGPVLVTAVTSQWRVAGWLALGAVFALAILANRPLAAWAVRTRPRDTPA
jgi:hypothetical protein